MPKVLAQGKTIECNRCTNLRKVLLHNGIDLYNGGASLINCRSYWHLLWYLCRQSRRRTVNG
jgi:hypothetical protein